MREPVFDLDNDVDLRIPRDDRTLALLAHALSFVEGGIIGPLIVYLVKRKESPFVAFHALQSFYFGLAFLGAVILTLCTCIGPVVCAIAYFAFEVVACIKANEGKWYRLPIVGNWAISRHPMPPLAPDGQPPVGTPPSGADCNFAGDQRQ